MYGDYGYRPSRMKRAMEWLWNEMFLPLVAIIFSTTTFFILVLSGPIMWLWNGCFVPAFLTLPHFGFWQTFGILIMFRLIKGVITG